MNVVFNDGVITEVIGETFNFDFCGCELILHRQKDVPAHFANRINRFLFVTEKKSGFILAVGHTIDAIKTYLNQKLKELGVVGIKKTFKQFSKCHKLAAHLQEKDYFLTRLNLLSASLGVEVPLCDVNIELIEARVDVNKLKTKLGVKEDDDVLCFIANKFGQKQAELLKVML